MIFKENTKKIIKEITNVLEKTDNKQTKEFIKQILKHKKIFFAATGRSKLIAETFAMRLVQLGIPSYILGETSTPKISKGNLVIVISGSGKTKITNDVIESAKKQKAKIILITSKRNSLAGKKADFIVEIKAKSKYSNKKTIEPLGSLFEASTLIYLDEVFIELMQRLNINEKKLKKRHSKTH